MKSFCEVTSLAGDVAEVRDLSNSALLATVYSYEESALFYYA